MMTVCDLRCVGVSCQAVRRPSRRLCVRARAQKRPVDVVGIANLCVDVRIPLTRLPVQRPGWQRAVMQEFKQQPPKEAIWETAGIANTLFAASRMGMQSAVIAHVGQDVHGEFVKESLECEGIEFVEGFDLDRGCVTHPLVEETAVCLVLVDPSQRHLFCSGFDITPGPVFCNPAALTSSARQLIEDAKALVMNGYAFQECNGQVLEYVFERAVRSGTATFFDPGPYSASMVTGSAAEKAALTSVLRRSHVILVTQEEAAALTGASDPNEAGRKLLELKDSVIEWVVIKLGARGSLFFQKGRPAVYTPGFRVPVSDTVGCGDSFGAAVILGYLNRQRGSQGVMELANAVGAVTATRCGAGRSVANLKEVQMLLEHHLERHSVSNGGMGIAAALELIKSVHDPVSHV